MLTQALILCGGMGTRLGELTASTPKPMLSVGGRPFLEHLISEVSRFGFRRIVLLAGRFGHQVVEEFDGRYINGAAITVIVEPVPLGTGGALSLASSVLEDEFLLMNGDSWIDADLVKFAQVFEKTRSVDQGLEAQILLHEVSDAGRFGSVAVENGRIVSFREKSANSVAKTGLINAGVYALTKRVLDLVPSGKSCSFESEILPALVAQGKVGGVVAPNESYFIDIGVPETFARVQIELIERRTRPAIFFDRDGTLNRDNGYTHRIDDLVWMPEAKEAIAYANDLGFLVFVVTNQSGVAKGLYDETAIADFHAAMQRDLAAIGGHIDGIEWCPFHVEAVVEKYRRSSRRRKPSPGMLEDIIGKWPIDVSRSHMIGDSDVDMEAAAAAGVHGIRYSGGSVLELLRSFVPS